MKFQSIPNHIGIILDGNGRWATDRGLSRIEGHKVGAERVIDITRYCDELGVKALSLYAFSTENWKRPKTEVSGIMQLLSLFINTYLKELNDNNVKLSIMGDIEKIPLPQKLLIKKAINTTFSNTGLRLIIGLNYGGRDEIVRTSKKLMNYIIDDSVCNCSDDVKYTTQINKIKEKIKLITEEDFSHNIDIPEFANLDLLIRTGGDIRISNFMLWQIAYSEFYFTDTKWPDFERSSLDEAITVFNTRNRRFGGLK